MEQKLRRVPYYGLIALLTYMPFHIFLAQSLSLLTGGLSAWKVAKDVLTGLLLIFMLGLVWQQRKHTKTFDTLFLLALVYGLLHLLVWALNPHIYRESAILGIVYNGRLTWYLLIGMGAGLLLGEKIKLNQVTKLILITSTLVSILGILQYFLPKDILTHVGYSTARGVKPSFFIDNKPDLPRIMSTLRDPNSLGAYLLLPITVLFYYLVAGIKRNRLLISGVLGLHLLALFLTFSRSAWLGTILSVGILLTYLLRNGIRAKIIRYWPLFVVGLVVFGGLVFVFRNNYAVQNILQHSDKSTKLASSDTLHARQIHKGLKGIVHKPLGHGPGTAGLTSIKDPKGGLLPENYYVQIGYEVGILGLILFIAINVVVYLKLLAHKTPMAVCLLASFWGYVLVNMLLQIWSNEAVAAQWWLLAGLAIGLPLATKTKHRS